jgi:exosortase family protein XrtG
VEITLATCATVTAIVIWLALLVFFRYYRIWLPFYVLGSVGLGAAIVYFGHYVTPVELWLRSGTAFHTQLLATQLGITTTVFTAVPGALMALVTSGDVGWTVVNVDIECSALLEMAALVGLFAFYPAWTFGKKAPLIILGLAATYVANILRMLTILAVLHWGGKDTLFVTHTVVARALFFALTVFIYWFLLTKPTVRTVSQRLRRGEAP